jgi:hypothetical protein
LKINSWDPAQDGNLEKVWDKSIVVKWWSMKKSQHAWNPKTASSRMQVRWTSAAAEDLENIANYLFEKTPENAQFFSSFWDFGELVFLSWVFGSNLPRRSADIDAFMRYQGAPTERNKDLWLKEREKDTK